MMLPQRIAIRTKRNSLCTASDDLNALDRRRVRLACAVVRQMRRTSRGFRQRVVRALRSQTTEMPRGVRVGPAGGRNDRQHPSWVWKPASASGRSVGRPERIGWRAAACHGRHDGGARGGMVLESAASGEKLMHGVRPSKSVRLPAGSK